MRLTRRQARFENQGTIATILLIGILSLLPTAVQFLGKDGVSIPLALGPILVYGWILFFYGPRRIRMAVLLLFAQPAPANTRLDLEAVNHLMTGYLLAKGKLTPGVDRIEYSIFSPNGPTGALRGELRVPVKSGPMPAIGTAPSQSPAQQVEDLPEGLLAAIEDHLVGSQTIYHHWFSGVSDTILNDPEMTSHEKMAAVEGYHRAVAAAWEARPVARTNKPWADGFLDRFAQTAQNTPSQQG